MTLRSLTGTGSDAAFDGGVILRGDDVVEQQLISFFLI